MAMTPMNGALGTAPTSGQPGAPANKELGQKDFLKLMIAQIKSQDPMDPKTNGDFMAQLAQFSANDGISKMQETIQQLATSLQSTQALQATSLVGRKVLVPSEKLTLDTEGEAKAAVYLPDAVKDLTLSVFSEAGDLIKKIPLGQQVAGFFNFGWDGLNDKGERMPAGKYSIKVHGNYEGQEVAVKTLTAAMVDSVSMGQNGEGVKLNVNGVGAIALNEVRQIIN